MAIKRRVVYGLVMAVLFGWTASSSAQITTGVVSGVVKDAQGGVIPGATVTLTSEARNTQLSPAVSNTAGAYTFPSVPADSYRLEVTMSGFKTVQQNNLRVSGGDRVTVSDIVLEIGGATEVVNVAAADNLIQTQSGERSFTVTSEAVTNLPFVGRSFLNMALLAPGVGGVAASAAGATEQNIQRLGGGGSSNFTVDGVGLMDTGNGNAPLLLNTDAVAEVKIITSGYQAEFGRSSGMQISATTKSGTNGFHGSLYTIERNSDWEANSWANERNGREKEVNRERDWGYTLGGPVGRAGGDNKLFFFVSHEWRPRETSGAVRLFRLPTALERDGDFSQSRDNRGNIFNLIRDASTGLPCTASNTAGCFQADGVLGRIPQDRLYQVGLNILRQFPMPNDESGYATANSYNYRDVDPKRTSRTLQETYRGDFQANSALRFSAKLITQRMTTNPNQPLQAFSQNQQGNRLLNGYNDAIDPEPNSYQYSVNLGYTINSTTFFEGSFGKFTRTVGTMTITPQSNRNNVGLTDFPLLIPTALDLDPNWAVTKAVQDQVFYENGKILGQPFFNWGSRVGNRPPHARDIHPLYTKNDLYDFSMNFTKIAGSHTMKAGYFLQHSWKPQSDRGLTGLPRYVGDVNFGEDSNNPLDSGFGFANAALGIVSEYGQRSGVLEGTYVYNNHEFFVQDNWKVNQRLTMDYGLRFVRAEPIHDINGAAGNWIPSEWDPSQAPLLYNPVCAPGRTAPCSGLNLRAQDPITGAVLPAGSGALVGQIVPGSGNVVNGVFNAGQGPVADTVYELPSLSVAPRFGFAYDMTGTQSFIIRGGAGLFHDRTLGNDVYGMVGNPASAYGATVNYVRLSQLSAGEGFQGVSPKRLAAIQYDSPMTGSWQWNIGTQFALPAGLTGDVSYVGNHGFNSVENVDINSPAFGAAFRPENQDPTKVETIPGSAALSTDFYRPFAGLGRIGYLWAVSSNTFHSLQTSLNRRFRDGVQMTVNYTLSRNKGTAGNGVLVDASPGQFSISPDQDAYANHITGNDRTHVLKANFVWDMPDMRADGGGQRVLSYLVNDWQLAGIFTGGSGAPYTPGFSIRGASAVNLTGTPNYNARIVVTGDPGSGCSSDYTRQFNTSAFQGPQPGSNGLESGLNFMRGCADRTMDLSLSRVIRLGSNRSVQLRVDALNVLNTVVINGRNASVQYASIANVVDPINSPYDANGNLVEALSRPQGAGFGVATSAQSMRAVQMQVRFAF